MDNKTSKPEETDAESKSRKRMKGKSETVKIPDEEEDEDIPFKDLSSSEKLKTVVIVIAKICSFLLCLYVFICSLGLLESAFQLLGGKAAGEAFSSGVLSNPLAGLMIGVLATVLMQSSSTSTSIVVTMVGSEVIPIEKAVPIIMGANIGTSVTNTLVSLAQAGNRKEFRRAFAGATVHDMFNWMTVIVLLPIEILFGYLHWLSGVLVDSMGFDGKNDEAPDMLKAITEPVLKSIVKVNKDIIKEVAQSSNNSHGSVLVRWCKVEEVVVNKTIHNGKTEYVNCTALYKTSPLHEVCLRIQHDGLIDPQNTPIKFEWNTTVLVTETHNLERCANLFAQTDLDDIGSGVILLIASLILMLSALMLIVKILNSMLNGSISKVIKKTINADLPGPFAYFTGYLAILVGCGMTIVVQSSSIFTSTLTPLVGLGIVDIERMYPMTLGSNIGTTVTAVLAALSQSGEKLEHSIQIAMCHLFFNLTGLLLYYPIPFMRVPIGMANVLGKTTAKHRWFAIFYIIAMFILFPGIIFALSYAGYIYLGAIGGPIFLLFIIVVIINAFQRKKPHFLPRKLQNWNFLPEWMHSLKPVDRLIARVFRCAYCQNLLTQSANIGDEEENDDDHVDDDDKDDDDKDDDERHDQLSRSNQGFEPDENDVEMAPESKITNEKMNGLLNHTEGPEQKQNDTNNLRIESRF